MARKRLAMEVRSKKARLTSLEKRKKSLRKSAHELSTLCGVSIGMIICNEAEVWPPSPDPVARLIKLYKSGSGQDGMGNRTCGVSDYFKEKRERVEEQIKKMREGRYAKWEEDCKSFSEDQWRELGDFLKAKIGAVREKITSLLRPDIGQQQQQHWPYFGTQDYTGSLEGSRPETRFIMNPYLQESEIYMPEIAGQHQNLALYEAQNSIVMNSNGSSCSEGIDNYTYLLNHNHNSCERWRIQTEMMEKVEVEPFMSYHMLNKETMLQNWQGLMPMSAFPEIHENWGMPTEMVEKVDIRQVETLMSYDMPNEETMLQNWQGLMSMSAFPEMQATQEGYYKAPSTSGLWGIW